MIITPRIPSGFLELLPGEQIAFNQMLETIRKIYELFGYTPIETPAMELSEVLLAKTGGETEKQVYRIDRSGAGLCLHFDLTVPLARYVAEHLQQLTLPFRRYQIQKVWRGESAQRGRFREFYQADIDVIGSHDPLVDAEIPSVIYFVFRALGFTDFTIRISNRKVLNGFLQQHNLLDKSREVLTTIDKLGKTGADATATELSKLGLGSSAVDLIVQITTINGEASAVLAKLDAMNCDSPLFREGIKELEIVSNAIPTFGVPQQNFKLDLSIARGLDYYTGTVYETMLDKYPDIGSVCSGGRYNDLAGYYTDVDLPGVGTSIGLTRLFVQLKEAGLLDIGNATPSRVVVTMVSPDCTNRALEVATALRNSGVNTEVYLYGGKIGKQLKYAGALRVPFTIIIGENEIEAGVVTLRDMASGEQQQLSLEQAINTVKQ